MSSQEFFGIVLGLAMALQAIMFMKIAYESAKYRRVKEVLKFLKLAGFLSFGSWGVMTLAMLHFGQHFEKAMQARLLQPAVPAEQIAEIQWNTTDLGGSVLTTPRGTTIRLRYTHAGLHGLLGPGGRRSGTFGFGGRSMGDRERFGEFSSATAADGGDGGTRL